MIIFGTRPRQQVTDRGKFFCPKCGDIRPYERKHLAHYFTLYFIPVFKTKDVGEVVECQVCKSQFDPRVLEAGSQSMFKLVALARFALLHGTSLPDVRSRLLAEGLDDAAVDRVIEMAQRS